MSGKVGLDRRTGEEDEGEISLLDSWHVRQLGGKEKLPSHSCSCKIEERNRSKEGE